MRPVSPRPPGFTLTEVLLVLGILGLLAALLAPNLIGARARAYDAAALTCARALKLAAVSDHLSRPEQPFPEAQSFRGSVNECRDPALQVATLSVDADAFEYTVTHPQGRHTMHATRISLQAREH